ncbi:MAG: CSLREA domain-containing protein, partial [Acidobacteriota bacterium]
MQGLRAIHAKRFHLLRLLCAAAFAAILLASTSARAATITVNSAADTTANDGVCTLREAITAANTDTASGAAAGECAAGALGLDTIVFAIPAATDPGCVVGTGVCTIAPAFALPNIIDAVTIDGYTQTGAVANTNTVASQLGLNGALKIQLTGTAGGNGLTIRAPAVTVRGLVVNGFTNGIDARLSAGGTITLEGNYVGTNVTGTAVAGNGSVGINTGGTGSIVIGGTTPAARNLISGNGRSLLGPGILTFTDIAATIQGNLIGTDVTGLVALANGGPGINANPVTQAITVGGTAAGAGNLVTGNGYNNVSIFGGTGHFVQGNLVGTNVTGTAALPSDMPFIPGNPRTGVHLVNTSNTLVGGTTVAARNIISGNVSGGVDISTVTGSAGGSNQVQGNYIGTDITGTVNLGNSGFGVLLSNSPGSSVGGSVAGAPNIIAFTVGGVGIGTALGVNNSLLGNSIHSNGGIGIDLGGNFFDGVTPNSPGGSQNYPVLTAAPIAAGTVNISGTLNGTASSTFRIEFFSSAVGDPTGYGEGQTFLGFANVTTDGTGNVSFGPLPFAVP